ncbi:MAG: hypothetical protein PHU49_03090 [Syntrophorhabdaceae bacterium]|nr:hypothetical protein [Syntrophorhabdaceae bacterium]MDD5242982.1 hypothetical protein [Syntrophorhabdaceae bacterium]
MSVFAGKSPAPMPINYSLFFCREGRGESPAIFAEIKNPLPGYKKFPYSLSHQAPFTENLAFIVVSLTIFYHEELY